ncbi:MAG TPA: hypothetical protein VGH59_06020 [Casimicrobiaceae bacterium]
MIALNYLSDDVAIDSGKNILQVGQLVPFHHGTQSLPRLDLVEVAKYMVRKYPDAFERLGPAALESEVQIDNDVTNRSNAARIAFRVDLLEQGNGYDGSIEDPRIELRIFLRRRRRRLEPTRGHSAKLPKRAS